MAEVVQHATALAGVEEKMLGIPGAATDPPDRARMMVKGWGVNILFTPMKSLLQAVP